MLFLTSQVGLVQAFVHLETRPHESPCWGRWGACEFNPLTVLEVLLEPPLDLTASNYVSIDFGDVYHGCPIDMLEDKVFDTTGVN